MEIPFIEYMTSPYGDMRGRTTPARGISVAPGGQEFPAWVSGTVEASEYRHQLGNVVIVRNDEDGHYIGVAHLATREVQKGDRVSVGDILGVIGQTGSGCVGRCAFIWVVPGLNGWKTIDPVEYARK